MPNYYGQYFPQSYPQNYGYQPQANQQIQQPQIQNGGFLTAPSEEYALNYPVGMGNCVTFKVEGKPIVIEKSMGFSQLESPKVERYRLMKEDSLQPTETALKEEFDVKSLIDRIDKANDEIEAIWDEIGNFKNAKDKKTKRDRDGDDRYDE